MKNENNKFCQAIEREVAWKKTENGQTALNTTFDANHTWCTTVSGDLTITNIPSGTKEVQLLVNVKEDDGETSKNLDTFKFLL